MSELTRFGISMDAGLLERFDALIASKHYQNRSEAIRDLVRDYLVEHEWETEDVETMGTITLVYNHHVRDLNSKLTDIQHASYEKIVSTMHVHINHHNCLEVIVVKGRAGEITRIADSLISAKGVMLGKLTMATTGSNL